jgi:hypothetical protein
LAIRTETGTLSAPAQSPRATVRCTNFELTRAASGRRSLRQIRALEWTGDACPECFHIAIATARATDLIE